MSSYRVLLFYAYSPIAAPQQVCAAQRALCERLGLRGRILVATEGINATLSGTRQATDAYIQALCAGEDPALGPVVSFSDIKQSPCTGHVFPRLRVRVRPEIVHADMPPLRAAAPRGKYLSPKTLRAWLQTLPEDVLLLDVRDGYEHALGHFRGAVTLPMRYFREFQHQATARLAPLKHKRVITYCTGGVRCEKATALLLSSGFAEVYQLQGGIIAYGQQTDGAFFEGSCYVFDARLRCAINRVQPTVIGRCYRCQSHSERMVNCAYVPCHRHMLLCRACATRYADTCSTACHERVAQAACP